MEAFKTIDYDLRGHVAVIRMNRPERMNALGVDMKRELKAAFFERAAQDSTVRAVVLTGAGERAFCAGADIKEQARRAESSTGFMLAQRETHKLFRSIEQFDKPVLAAINGVAMGGGLELALCADLRVCAASARMGMPEALLGAMPAAGGTQRLPRLIGEARAKEMLLLGDPIDAPTALAFGLVNRVIDPADLMDEALALAAQLADRAPLAIQAVKRAVSRGLQVDLDSGLEIECYAASLVFDTDDRREGMQAFVEKRKPVFNGH